MTLPYSSRSVASTLSIRNWSRHLEVRLWRSHWLESPIERADNKARLRSDPEATFFVEET